MRRVIPAAVVALCLLGPTAGLAGETGSSLLRRCEGAGTDRAYCLGYLAAVASAGSSVGTWCMPDGLKDDPVRQAITKWLTENPDMLHVEASTLLWLALTDAFPCEAPGPAAPAPRPGK